MQRGPEFLVLEDVAADVGADDLLERVVAVDGVDRLADVVVELAVVDRAIQPGLVQLDDAGQQARLGQREERVDPRVVGALHANALVAVEALDLLVGEQPAAVVGAADVAEAIDLEQVAVDLVDEHAAQHEGVIVGDRADLLGIAAVLHQALDGEIVRELLEPAQVVDRQRVVHVEADQLDLGHVQVAVDEDLARHRGVVARRLLEDALQLVVGEQFLRAHLGGLGGLAVDRGAEAAVNRVQVFPFADTA